MWVGNLAGALATAVLVYLSGQYTFGAGAVGEAALATAAHKSSLGFVEAVALGILCNALVCLAVWLAIGARSVTDKILAILFPITAFVAIGFEHSIANWFMLPFGLAVDRDGVVSIAGFVTNIVAVTAGNVIGGTLLVAGVYWLAYLRGSRVQD